MTRIDQLNELGIRRTYNHLRTRLQFWISSLGYWRLGEQISLGNNVQIQKLSSFYCTKLSNIKIGDDTIIYEFAKIEARGNGAISIGKESVLGDIQIYSREKITIGEGFLASWGTLIQDYNAHSTHPAERRHELHCIVKKKPHVFSEKTSPIIIGNNVWMGAYSIILKGANIGNNCVIAPLSVVLKGDYPDNSLISGNPARAQELKLG